MLKNSVITLAVIASLTPALVALGQQPSGQESNAGTAQPADTTMVHVEGCVFPTRALTADAPVIVPSTSDEDFVLTNIKVIAGSVKEEGVTYKLEQVTQDRLRELHSKRVGVTGRIGQAVEQPQLQVVSIREITGSCPRVPGRA